MTIKVKIISHRKGLNQFIKNMDFLAEHHAEIGILEDSETPEGASQLEVARTHEYGSTYIPKRSFLKMPMEMHQKQILAKFQALCKIHMFKADGGDRILYYIGIFAKGFSLQAFKTGGFGKWKKLAPITIALKNSKIILVDTGSMMQKIQNAVIKNSD